MSIYALGSNTNLVTHGGTVTEAVWGCGGVVGGAAGHVRGQHPSVNYELTIYGRSSQAGFVPGDFTDVEIDRELTARTLYCLKKCGFQLFHNVDSI